MNLKVGTCGWSYPDWVGPFYPAGTRGREMLAAYARSFDTVEVNSTFYATPPRQRVEGWANATPESFTFSVKAPKALTHEAGLDLDAAAPALDAFLEAIGPLAGKMDTVLLQLPPSLRATPGRQRLEDVLASRAIPAPLALEARHESWEDPATFQLLRDHDVTWAWSHREAWSPEPVLTTDRGYVRLIGDRELSTFDRLQRDRTPTLRTWYERLAERHDELSSVRVYANNHFAGFGPGTANTFLGIAGQPRRSWAGHGGDTVQRGLDEFP